MKRKRKQIEIVFQVLTQYESQRIVPRNENLKRLDALNLYASLNLLMFHNTIFSISTS